MPTAKPYGTLIEYLHLVSASSNSIHLRWGFRKNYYNNILESQVYTQRHNSLTIQHGDRLDRSVTDYTVSGLTMNNHYKICLAVFNDNLTEPFRSPDVRCLDATTQSWHIPVSVGSSLGAILALGIIIFIVLLSQCKSKTISSSLNRKSSRYDSQYDSQIDSTLESSYYNRQEISDITMEGDNSNEYSGVSGSEEVSDRQQQQPAVHLTIAEEGEPQPTQRFLSADYSSRQTSPRRVSSREASPRRSGSTREASPKNRQVMELQDMKKTLLNGKEANGSHCMATRVNTV